MKMHLPGMDSTALLGGSICETPSAPLTGRAQCCLVVSVCSEHSKASLEEFQLANLTCQAWMAASASRWDSTALLECIAPDTDLTGLRTCHSSG